MDISPEAITTHKITELHSQNATKSRSDKTSMKRSLTKAASEQVYVIHVLVQRRQFLDHVLRHFSRQVLKCKKLFLLLVEVMEALFLRLHQKCDD